MKGFEFLQNWIIDIIIGFCLQILSFNVSPVTLFNFFCLCRWRDVKMRAFENADHRTYVDLKVRCLSVVPTI